MAITDANLRSALKHAAAGLPVFPALILKRGDKWIKKPAIEGWQTGACSNEAQIRAWWKIFPHAVPGIELGRAGLVVLDPDRHPGSANGTEAFEHVIRDNGGLPPGPLTDTPAGSHYYFQQPTDVTLGNNAGALPAGIDIRGVGGFVIAPEAVRSDGTVYRPREGSPLLTEAYRTRTIPALPPKLIRLITAHSYRSANGAQPKSEERVNVDTELAELQLGKVNSTHCRVIGSLLNAGEPYDEIVERIVDATMRLAAKHPELGWTREEEFRYVYKCTAALLKGRCREHISITGEIPTWVMPELRETWREVIEKGGRPLILWRRDAGWHIRDMSWAWSAKEGKEEPPKDEKPEQPSAAAGPKSDSDKKKSAPKIYPKPFDCFDFTKIPPREWLYVKHYMRGIASATIGPGGSGKSSLDLVEAIAMATGRDLLGEQPIERLRVWYHNGEDPTQELDRRIAAICVHFEIEPRDLSGYFFRTSGLDMPIKIAGGNGDVKLNVAVANDITTGIRSQGIDVLVLDPLITLHSLAEAENHKMDPVLREFARIANETDSAIELAHHTRKKVTGQEDYTTADSRGASAIMDAVRSARTINGLNDADAKRLGIDDELERISYFRLDKGKANMTRRGAASYFQFASVELPNGPGGGPGDDVGVVTRIIPPDATIEVTPTDIAILQAETVNTDCAVSNKSMNWFGRAVARHFSVDLNTPLGVLKVENVIEKLRREGVITKETRRGRDPKDRHRREFWTPGEK
jgi:AAA domain/Bifunctional DNA primase/polymerase, N-terminal